MGLTYNFISLYYPIDGMVNSEFDFSENFFEKKLEFKNVEADFPPEFINSRFK